MAIKVSELIEKIKKEQGLTDEDMGKWIGLSGTAFRLRRSRNSFSVWQFEKLIARSGISNAELLALFGRKEPELDRQVLKSLQLIFDEVHNLNTDVRAAMTDPSKMKETA